MSPQIHNTYHGEQAVIHQYNYPSSLYNAEVQAHALVVDEYMDDITDAMRALIVKARPNTRLIANQPYLTTAIRLRLVDFGLKMLVRLKVLPFVFCRAVRLFDRYCLKRVVLADQGQLVMATCVWIALKVHGGNCHFANMNHDRKDPKAKTILDLGYGAGARFHGPTHRFRQPRVVELIRLCGARCNYTPRMFNQMELYIMSSLDWNLTEPGIDDYLVSLDELHVTPENIDPDGRPVDYEFRRMKQFVAYAACFLYEMIGYNVVQLAKAAVDVINQTFRVHLQDPRFQTPNPCIGTDASCADYAAYSTLRRYVVSAIVRAPVFLLDCFSDKGPQHLFHLLTEASFSVPLEIHRPHLLRPSTSPPLAITPTSSQISESPLTSQDFTYENVTEVARSFKRIIDGPKDLGDVYPRMWRRNLAGLLTPTLSAANVQSHQYPVIHPAPPLYVKPSESQGSVRSSSSSKECDIFDSARQRLGVLTPATDDSDCKDRKSSLVDASVSAIKKFF